MSSDKKDFDLLFETSWEVCNKVGGIYTVLSTKANTLRSLYGDKVIFIGPDVWTAEKPSPFFTESAKLLGPWRQQLKLPDGVGVRVGYWEVPGRPVAVLVKFDGMYAVKDEFYGRMWEHFGVDSLHAYGDYDEGCAFGHAAALVIADMARYRGLDSKPSSVIAHFDEWTTGMGLLATRLLLPRAATVFTTHATSMGRSICSNGKPLYDYLHNYDGDQMSRELNMESKHSLEKAAAHEADVFTTVSGITAEESAQLLQRQPDVVTPNGFEPGFVPSGAEYTRRRRNARALLASVAGDLTGNSFDPDQCFIVATSGRFEFRNKGLDVFLDSMRRFADSNPGRRVLAFVMVPAWSAGPRADLAARMNSDAAPVGPLPDPFVTHRLNNPDTDAVMCRMRQLGFDAASASGTTVIYVPCYLNGDDGIFNRSYYDLLIGLDATVFPSYYEPWGYTPLESVAFGVPTVTTSLSGFGRYILDNSENSFEACGVKVIHRTDSNYGEVCDNIASCLSELCDAGYSRMQEIRKAARLTAAGASWTNFIVEYIVAYRQALDKAMARTLPAAGAGSKTENVAAACN